MLLGLLLIAGSRWTAPRKTAARAFVAVALALFLVRLSAIGAEWLENDRFYAELLPAFDNIPAGSRVAIANPTDPVDLIAPSLAHFPAFAVGAPQCVRAYAFCYSDPATDCVKAVFCGDREPVYDRTIMGGSRRADGAARCNGARGLRRV